MMREPTARRRSPESSRRRRAERRHSREQLAAAAAVAAGVVAAQPSPLLPQQPPPGSEVGDGAIIPPVSSSQTHTPTQHMLARSSSQTQTPTQHQYHRSRADSTTSASSSTSSSLVNVSRRSRFGIRNFFALSSVKKVKKRRSFKRKNYSTSSVDSDLAYGKGYVSRSSFENDHRPSPSHHQQLPQYPQQHQPYIPGAFSQVSGAYPAATGPYSPHHYSQHGHHPEQDYPPPLPHQYGHPHPKQEPDIGPDSRRVLKRDQTDEEILAIGRKLSDLARAENLRDLERQGKSRPSRMVATAAAVSAFHRKNSGGTRGISSSRPNKSQSSSSDEEWESASDSDSDSDSPSSDSDSGLAYGSMPRFSDPVLPPLTALAGTVGVMGAAIGAGSMAPTIISERPSEAIRPPDRKPSAVDPAMFGPVNSLRGYVNTPCGFRPGEYVSPTQSQYQSPSLVHRVTAENPIPLPGSASNEALLQRQRQQQQQQQQHRFDQPITATNLGTPVQIQAPRPRIPVSPQVLEERGHHRDHEMSTGSPRKRRDRERERDKESSISAALPAVVGAIGAAAVAGAVMNNNDEKRRSDERRDEKLRRDDDYDRERRHRYDDDGRRSAIDVNDKRDERYDRRDYVRPPTSDVTRSDERYRDSQPHGRERDHRYNTPTGRDRDHDRHLQRESENKSGVAEVITPAVIGAVAGAVLAAGARRDSKTSPVHRASPSVERDYDEAYKERMRLEQEVKRHREDSDRHAREEKRLRDEYEARMKEIREKAEEEERRAREEKKKQDWIEQQERIVREQRKIIYQQERVANDGRERAERDRRSRDVNQKREREEKRVLEASGGRDPSRDKERSRDRRKDVVVVVEGRPDVADSAPAPVRSEVSKGKEREVAPPPPSVPALEEKKPSGTDSLAPVAKKKSKEERRQAREELRKLLAETQKQIEAEKERERRLAEMEAIQGAPSAVTVEPPAELSRREPSGGSSSQAPAIDPFQFQVPTDAFPTPSYTPPTERPLTPAVRTVEPDWDQLEPEPEEEVRERLSRRESYELEIARAQKIVDETNKSTIPVDPATIAAAIAVVESSENDRERSRSRAPSRGRDREPVRDRVQEEANRVYRERKLAERIAEEESRSRSVSPSPSVMDKYEDIGEDPVVRIVTPPEMKRAPKKSVFDGPNADVRIDNVIMPHDLVKYQAPPPIPGVNPAMMMPIFKSRDPSCERERPMLILVLPTPAVSPNPEKMMRAVSSSSQAATVVDAEPPREKTEPATPPRSPKKEPKIIMGPRGEAVEVPDDYDTGRVRASPESRDASQERKPFKFKFGSAGKKTNTWSMMAAAIAGASAIAAKRKEEAKAGEGSNSRAIEGEGSSSAVVEEKPKPEVVTADPPSEAREVVPEPQQREVSPVPTISEPPSTPPQQRRPAPIDLEDEAPPRVGPKPSSFSPSSSRMPGSFGEDLDFNATVAAGLEASGFDPNIVIKNEEFRRRDSPRGSNQPFYVPPSVETIADASDSRGPSPAVVTAEPIELPIVPAESEQDPGLSSREKSTSSELPGSSSGSKKGKRRSRRNTKDEYVDVPEHGEPPDRPREEDFSGKVPSNLSREASSFQVVDQPKEESFRVVERELTSARSDAVDRANGHHDEIKYTDRNSQQITDDGDKQSFLAKAGTSGDGAGLMGAEAFAAALVHLNAAPPSPRLDLEKEVYEGKGKAKETAEPFWRRERSVSYGSQKIDPEVQVHREIKPAIDPQFGDLLPLPPSEPNSPGDPSFYELNDFFPSLPESRPNTPPQEQRTRSATVTSRRQGQGHVRTPSRTAVPLPLVMGRRSVPSSPRVGRSSPVQGAEQLYSPPKSRQARPTSWDLGTEYKPLWLIEKKAGEDKRGQNVADYPALPESESEPPSSAPESPGFDAVARGEDVDVSYLQRGSAGLGGASLGALGALGAGRMLQDQLEIDVPLARSFEQQSSGFGSGETTPRAFAADEFAQSPEARRNDIESLEQMSPVGSVHIESQSTTDKEDDVQDLEQLSPVVVPFKAPARRLSFGDDLELLPGLPENLPISPVEQGPSPTSLDNFSFGGLLEDLPALPASPVKKLAEEEVSALPTLPESRALSPLQKASIPDVPIDTLELPTHRESSYGTSIDDKNSPHTREDGTELLLASSGPVSPVLSTMPQTTESAEVAGLPALPDSAPGSPLEKALPRLFDEIEELPPLPESRADSPAPALAVLPRTEEFEDASALPALPQARPGTPDFERLPALPWSRAPSPVSVNLPTLPDSGPGSPVIETLPALPQSRSPSPIPSGLPISDLPGLPESRADTLIFGLPTSLENVPVPGIFADLPALPESEPATPIQTDLPAVPASRSLSSATTSPTLPESQPAVSILPALPESRSTTPVLSDVSASVEDRSASPAFEDALALPENKPLGSVLSALPALPESTPESPVFSTETAVVDDEPAHLDSETALPESEPVSPISSSQPALPASRSLGPAFAGLPALPKSRPASPVLSPLPALSESKPAAPAFPATPTLSESRPASLAPSFAPRPRSGSHFFTTLFSLPVLSGVQSLSRSRPSSPLQKPSLPNETLEEIPALPLSESGPVSPVDGLSKSLAAALEKVSESRAEPESQPESPVELPESPGQTIEDLYQLPALPDSQPESPLQLPEYSAQTVQDASQPLALSESQTVSLPPVPEDVSELPALPESLPTSPALEQLPVLEDSQPTAKDSVDSTVTEDLSELPALPENRPLSPVRGFELPALPESHPGSPVVETVQQQSFPVNQPVATHEIESLPAIPESKSISSILEPVLAQELESLPALPDSKPVSPVLDPVPVFTPELETLPMHPQSKSVSPIVGLILTQEIDSLSALAGSRPISPVLRAVPGLELESLPALPDSKPASPILEPVTTQELEFLPTLSENKSISPVLEPVLATEPESLAVLSDAAPASAVQDPINRQLPDENLNNLPALPESPLASPVEDPVALQDLKALPILSDNQSTFFIQVPVSSNLHDEDLNQLPALPASQPISPILEAVLSEHQENLPESPMSMPLSPIHAPLSRRFPQEDMDELPTLPISPAHSPTSRQFLEETVDSLPALPESRPAAHAQYSFLNQFPEETLGTLPALPESQPMSPLETTLPTLTESHPVPHFQTAPPQPIGSYDGDLVDMPALPASQPLFPVEAPASRQLPSLDFDNLPTLPESQPISPAKAPGSTELLSQEFNELPALPDSLPVSPVQTFAPQLSDQGVDKLPSLPESQPGSPVLSTLTVLPDSQPLSPIQAPIHQLPQENFESLPALPDSRPLAPIDTPVEAPVEAPVEVPVFDLEENSEKLLALSDNQPASSGQSVDQLPTLPDSRSISPISARSSPQLLSRESNDLPVLPESRSLSRNQDFDDLLALPESRPISPVPGPASPQLPSQELDDLPALPRIRPVSRNQDFDDLPALPESQPMSPAQDPSSSQLPKEDLDQFPALPDSPLMSPAETAVPQSNSVETDLADLPALPQSLPASPVQKPVLPLIVTDLDRADSALFAKSAGKEVARVQEQGFAEISRVKDGNVEQLYKPPSSYSDIKTPPSPISSPISKRTLEKEKELETFDKGKSVIVGTAATTGASGTLVVANMRRDGSQPDIQRLGSEMQIPVSQDKSESVYSFNEDGASTIAVSEAPTYLSGSTFYESQLPEPTKKKDSPRQTFSSLLGLWSKREKTHPEPPAVSKVVAKVVPATTPEEEMAEDNVVPSTSKKDKKKKKQKKGEKNEGSESGGGSQQEQQRGESSGGLNIISSNQSTNDQPASSIVNKPVVSRYLPDDEPSPSLDQQLDEPSHVADVAPETEEISTPEEAAITEEVPATEEPPTLSKKSKKKKKKAKKAALEPADVAEEEAIPEAPVPDQDVAAEHVVPSETQATSGGELGYLAKDQDPSPQPAATDDVVDVEPAEREENVTAAPSRSSSISSPTTPTLTRDITKKGILSMLPAVSPFRPGFWGIKKQEPATQPILEEGPQLQSQQIEQGLGLGESSDRPTEVGPAEDVHKPEAKDESRRDTASLALDATVSLVENLTLVQVEAKAEHEAEKQLSDKILEAVEAEAIDATNRDGSKDIEQNDDKKATVVAIDEPLVTEEPVQEEVLVPETTTVTTPDKAGQEEVVDELSTIPAAEDVEAVEPATKKSKKKKKKKKAAATAVETEEIPNATNAAEQSVPEPVSEPSASSGPNEQVAPAAETPPVEDTAVVPETPVAETAPTKEITPVPAQVEETPTSITPSSKKSKKKKKKRNAFQSTETLTTAPIAEEPLVSNAPIPQPRTDPEPEFKQTIEDAAAISIPADDEPKQDADDAILGQQEPKDKKRQSVSFAESLEGHNIPGQVSRDSSEQPNISNSNDRTTPRGEDDNKPHQTEAHPVSEVFPSSLPPAQLPEKNNQNSQETVESALNEISSDRQDGVTVAVPLDLSPPNNNDAAIQDVSKEEPGFDTISLQQEQEFPAAPTSTVELTPELEPVNKEEADAGDGFTQPKSTDDVTSDSDSNERDVGVPPVVAADSTAEPLTSGASGSTAVTQPEPIAAEEAAALALLPDDTVDSDFPTDTAKAEEEKTSPIDEEKATSNVAQGKVQEPEEGQTETPAVPAVPAATPLQEQPQLGTIAVTPPQQSQQPIPTAASPIDATHLHGLTLTSSPTSPGPRSVSFALEAISPGSYTPTSSGAMSPVTEHESEDAAGASSRYSLRGKKREKRKKSTALKTAAVATPTAEEDGWPKTLQPASLATLDSPQQQPSPSQESFERSLHQLSTVAEETEPPSTSTTENDADNTSDGRSVLSLALGKRAETPSEFGGSMADSEGTTVGERNDEAGSSVGNGLLLVTRLKRVAGRMREKREKAALKKKSAISWPSSEVLEEEKQEDEKVEKELGKEDEMKVQEAKPREVAEERGVAVEAPSQRAEKGAREKAVASETLSQEAEQTAPEHITELESQQPEQNKAADLVTHSQLTEEVAQGNAAAELEFSSEQTEETAQETATKPEPPTQQTVKESVVGAVAAPEDVAPVPDEAAPTIETVAPQEPTSAMETVAAAEPTIIEESVIAPEPVPIEGPVVLSEPIPAEEPAMVEAVAAETLAAVDLTITEEPVAVSEQLPPLAESVIVSEKAPVEQPTVVSEATQDEENKETQPTAEPVHKDAQTKVVQESEVPVQVEMLAVDMLEEVPPSPFAEKTAVPEPPVKTTLEPAPEAVPEAATIAQEEPLPAVETPTTFAEEIVALVSEQVTPAAAVNAPVVEEPTSTADATIPSVQEQAPAADRSVVLDVEPQVEPEVVARTPEIDPSIIDPGLTPVAEPVSETQPELVTIDVVKDGPEQPAAIVECDPEISLDRAPVAESEQPRPQLDELAKAMTIPLPEEAAQSSGLAPVAELEQRHSQLDELAKAVTIPLPEEPAAEELIVPSKEPEVEPEPEYEVQVKAQTVAVTYFEDVPVVAVVKETAPVVVEEPGSVVEEPTAAVEEPTLVIKDTEQVDDVMPAPAEKSAEKDTFLPEEPSPADRDLALVSGEATSVSITVEAESAVSQESDMDRDLALASETPLPEVAADEIELIPTTPVKNTASREVAVPEPVEEADHAIVEEPMPANIEGFQPGSLAVDVAETIEESVVVAEESVVEPVAEELVVEEPVVKEPIIKEPAVAEETPIAVEEAPVSEEVATTVEEPTVEMPSVSIDALTESAIATPALKEPIAPSVETLPVEEPIELPVSKSQEVTKPSKKSKKKKKKGSKAGSSGSTSAIATPPQEISNTLEPTVEEPFLMLGAQDRPAETKTVDEPQSFLSEAIAVALPESDIETESALAGEPKAVQPISVVKETDTPEVFKQEPKEVPAVLENALESEVEPQSLTAFQPETSETVAVPQEISTVVPDPTLEASGPVKQHNKIIKPLESLEEPSKENDAVVIAKTQPRQEATRRQDELEQFLVTASQPEVIEELVPEQPVTPVEEFSQERSLEVSDTTPHQPVHEPEIETLPETLPAPEAKLEPEQSSVATAQLKVSEPITPIVEEHAQEFNQDRSLDIFGISSQQAQPTPEAEQLPIIDLQPDMTAEQLIPAVEKVVDLPTSFEPRERSSSIQKTEQKVELPFAAELAPVKEASFKDVLVSDASRVEKPATIEAAEAIDIAPVVELFTAPTEPSVIAETAERSLALLEEPVAEFSQVTSEQQDDSALMFPVKESKRQKREKNKKGKQAQVDHEPEPVFEIISVPEAAPKPASEPVAEATEKPAVELSHGVIVAPIAESTPEPPVQLVTEAVAETTPEYAKTPILEEVAPFTAITEAEMPEKPIDRQLDIKETISRQPEPDVEDPFDDDFLPPPTKKSKKNKKGKNVPVVIDGHDGGSGVSTPLAAEEQAHVTLSELKPGPVLAERSSNRSLDEAIVVEKCGSLVGGAPLLEDLPVIEEVSVTETPTVEVSVVEAPTVETPSLENIPVVEVEILYTDIAPVVEVEVVKESPTVEQEPVLEREPAVIIEQALINVDLHKPTSRPQVPIMLTREAEMTPLPPSRPQTPVLEKAIVSLPSTPANREVNEDPAPTTPAPQTLITQKQTEHLTVVTPASVTPGMGLLPEVALLPPINLEKTPPRGLKVQVDLTPAQENSHISHEPPFEYEGRRKRVKTREAEKGELVEPAVSAMDVAASLAGVSVDESPGKEKNKEESIVAATATLAGGVSLLDKLKGKEKEDWRVMGDENISVLTSGWDDAGSLLGGAPVYGEEEDDWNVGKFTEKGKKKEVVGSLFDEEDAPKVEKKSRRSLGNLPESGLGRMDSETIPRLLGELSGGQPEDLQRGRKMERGKSSPSPEPVQRSFSFPDDIADEEAFHTRDITADDKKEHVREMVPVADQPVRLPRMSSFGDFMRSHASLPPVQEELSEEDEPEKQKTPVCLSGFSGGSPRGSQSLKPAETEHIRDSGVSGVHLGHRSLSPRLDLASAPRNSAEVERQKRRSPLSGTVVRLQEPSPPPHTPEPEKSAVASAVNSSSAAKRIGPNTSLQRLRTPEPLRPDSPGSVGSIRSHNTATPPLRRMGKRTSGNLRSETSSQTELAAKACEQGHGQNSPDLSPAIAITAAGAASTPTTSPPIANEGRTRAAKDMSDVFEAYGEGRIGSPRSPTRPHSMRRRQSLQVIELEARVEQLIHENQQLANSRTQAESQLARGSLSSNSDREYEIEYLKRALQEANEVIERLKQTNEGLRSSTSAIAVKHHEEIRRFEAQQAQATKELQKQARSTKEKDAEIAHLRTQLEASTEEIKRLQRQILEQSRASVDSDFLDVRDIDYFDHRCQQLCAHVSQWVLRFSKFSDMRACRLTNELSDEKLIDRLDNAVLDGSNVDTYLNDRVRRRDIFMSMTMTMIWEFVFTRYLFGMDREQRQKLKHLEKQLIDVGPPHAVRQWRAVTLTLLSRRPGFKRQRDQDTEAVVQAILDTLAKILPPPSNLEDQIQAQLRRVVREAVGLAIEMRCQRAEYMMLPPLQPEYDDAGELVEDVKFNAALMNDGGQSNLTNEELESTGATVRVVLFPLVLRKGDDEGRGDDEIVVTPAQVLVARSAYASPATPTQSIRGKNVRLLTPISDAGGASVGGRSPKQERSPRGLPPPPPPRSDVSMGDHEGYI
ncbi:hypothetical protein QBC36DRAFT_361214 [Triangularia setosa]|uniref:Involucrin repeat protein n=1 Tax=Triangularia setosa TaxID=2587417 RepID=A0AAN6WI17_9PEZI|nr:hypothetical protein QBC36DRAFT_361214 [Podospora setosa]